MRGRSFMVDPNASAFPFKGIGSGLTKREYFAAMAMQGILANAALLESETGRHLDHQRIAVKSADALIAELNRAHSSGKVEP
jgi:hypothetical protein